MSLRWNHPSFTCIFEDSLKDKFLQIYISCCEIPENKKLLWSYPLKSGSAITTHTPNSQNPKHMEFSQISIQRVLSYEEWGQHPWEEKKNEITTKKWYIWSFQLFWLQKMRGLMFSTLKKLRILDLSNQACSNNFPKWFQTWLEFFIWCDNFTQSYSSRLWTLQKWGKTIFTASRKSFIPIHPQFQKVS